MCLCALLVPNEEHHFSKDAYDQPTEVLDNFKPMAHRKSFPVISWSRLDFSLRVWDSSAVCSLAEGASSVVACVSAGQTITLVWFVTEGHGFPVATRDHQFPFFSGTIELTRDCMSCCVSWHGTWAILSHRLHRSEQIFFLLALGGLLSV